MMGVRDFAIFGTLAAGLHLGAGGVLLSDRDVGGADAAGDGGQAVITQPASMAAAADWVQSWTQPPVAASLDPTPIALPPVATRAPAGLALPAMSPDTPRPTPDVPRLSVLPEQSAPPRIDTAPAELTALAPPVLRSPRPVARGPRADTPAPQLTRAAQPARQAAGRGETGARGVAGAAQTVALTSGQRQSLMSTWGAQIRARIDRGRPAVRGRGVVVLRLQVRRDGALAGVGIAQSSGNAALDQAAVQAVQRAGRFPAAPEGLREAQYGFSLPLRFR